MANRQFFPVECFDEETSIIAGFFLPQGTNPPLVPTGGNTASPQNLAAGAYTVTRTGVGVYNIKFLMNRGDGSIGTQPMALGKFLGSHFALGLSAPANDEIQFGSWTPSTATLVVNSVSTTPAAVEIAANASNVVFFALYFAAGKATQLM